MQIVITTILVILLENASRWEKGELVVRSYISQMPPGVTKHLSAARTETLCQQPGAWHETSEAPQYDG